MMNDMIFKNNELLIFENVILRVLDQSHADQLIKLASDKKIWEYAPEPFYEPHVFKEKWLNKAFAQMYNKERVSFAIFYLNEIVGSTSYYEINDDNKSINIGYTWFHPSFWGTKINAISKLILLSNAFDILNFNRVGFSVDSLNLRSCHSLQKLGIKQEYILRNHIILPSGRIRHSAIFSVIRHEWPEVKKSIITRTEL